jgi:hypothetical protein
VEQWQAGRNYYAAARIDKRKPVVRTQLIEAAGGLADQDYGVTDSMGSISKQVVNTSATAAARWVAYVIHAHEF